MNEETLRKLYDAGSEHYTMEEFQVFKTKMSAFSLSAECILVLGKRYQQLENE